MAKDKTATAARVVQPPAPEGAGAVAPGNAPAPAPGVTHLRVAAHVAGFRRAGRAWPVEPVEVSVEEFSDAQIEQLLAEPGLTVVPVVKHEEK